MRHLCRGIPVLVMALNGLILLLGAIVKIASGAFVLLMVISPSLSACRSPRDRETSAPEPTKQGLGASPAVAPPAASVPPATEARIGQLAPDFTLQDLDGKAFRLSEARGKTVVVEWFNPECPFVKASHTKGSLVGTADRHVASGGVWVAINSGAPGRQGFGAENSRAGKDRFRMQHPILLDESGAVGRLYGAKTTPHLFVIDAQGVLVYRGAIDNSPDGEGESPKGGRLVNYVDQALSAVREKKAVSVTDTEPYGCSVKYAQ